MPDWSKNFFPNNSRKIEELKKLLAREQDMDSFEHCQDREDEVLGEISDLRNKEEMFWHQRVKS